MADFLLTPGAGTNLKIGFGSLKKTFKELWPEIEIEKDKSGYLRWNLNMQNNRLNGELDPEGQWIGLEGDVIDIANFVIKIFPHLPKSDEYHFFDQGYSNEVLVKDSSSLADLANPFLLEEYKI